MDDSSPLPIDRNWVEMTGLTRRSALIGTAFAASFAAACQPVASTTVRTESDGIDEDVTSVTGADGFTVPLFVARPKGGGPAPAVIVIHEIFGVHEWVKDMCRRFAKEGYLAVAPDLFARAGDATTISDFKKLIDTVVAKTEDDQVLSDLDKVSQWVASHGAVGKPSITGFCWGGRIVWLYTAHSRDIASGVAFYGRLRGDAPLKAIDLADQLSAPVLGQYGGMDKGIPGSDVKAMNDALKAAGSASHITVYPEADHGFMADYRPSYNEPAAKAAWVATLAWFQKYRD